MASGSQTVTNKTTKIVFAKNKLDISESSKMRPNKPKLSKQNTVESDFQIQASTGSAVAKNKKDRLLNL